MGQIIRSYGLLDVAKRAYDNDEACDLIGLYILGTLRKKFPFVFFGLYKDDVLAISRGASGHTQDKLRKDLIITLVPVELKITIEIKLTIVAVGSGTYRLYRKPNERLTYINTVSCHPLTMLKILIKGASKKIMNFSFNEEIFDAAAQYYNESLAISGLRDRISQMPVLDNRRRKRHKNTI